MLSYLMTKIGQGQADEKCEAISKANAAFHTIRYNLHQLQHETKPPMMVASYVVVEP